MPGILACCWSQDHIFTLNIYLKVFQDILKQRNEQ